MHTPRKLRIVSNSEIFANRGDPWISCRDRADDYHTEDSENPDLDRWLEATTQKKRSPLVSKKLFQPSPTTTTPPSSRDPSKIKSVSKNMKFNQKIHRLIKAEKDRK